MTLCLLTDLLFLWDFLPANSMKTSSKIMMIRFSIYIYQYEKVHFSYSVKIK